MIIILVTTYSTIETSCFTSRFEMLPQLLTLFLLSARQNLAAEDSSCSADGVGCDGKERLVSLINSLGSAWSDRNELAKDDYVQLAPDVKMPRVGLGTYRVEGDDLVYDTLEVALENGYRLVDTGDTFNNHRSMARALQVGCYMVLQPMIASS